MSQGEVLELMRVGSRQYYYTCSYMAKMLKKAPATVATNIRKLVDQGLLERVTVISFDGNNRNAGKIIIGYRIRKAEKNGSKRQDKRR